MMTSTLELKTLAACGWKFLKNNLTCPIVKPSETAYSPEPKDEIRRSSKARS